MLKYPCLVLDHDDTVVRTEETINYPCFCQYLSEFHLGRSISLEDYIQGCFSLGFTQMCQTQFGFSAEECETEYRYWQTYIRQHMPQIYPGLDRILRRQKELGGYICVVSHSSHEIILRDYAYHFGIVPDAVYGWDLPAHQRKPSPYPLEDIMARFHLQPRQLLVVDDMTPGCDMARAAGVPIAFSAWGRKDYPEITAQMTQLCDHTFRTTDEMEKYLFEED